MRFFTLVLLLRAAALPALWGGLPATDFGVEALVVAVVGEPAVEELGVLAAAGVALLSPQPDAASVPVRSNAASRTPALRRVRVVVVAGVGGGVCGV